MRWAITLLFACGGGTPPTRSVPTNAIDAGSIAEAPIGERECNALLDHAVALGVAEQHAAKPPELVATDEAQAKLRADLAGELAGCRALPREAYRCALGATTLEALAACQASASSSTSNNSVAPGGILPPAAPVAP